MLFGKASRNKARPHLLAKKARDLGCRGLTFVLSAVLMLGNALGMIAPAVAYAAEPGQTVYVKTGEEYFYGGVGGTRHFWVDDTIAYCSDPFRDSPVSGYYKASEVQTHKSEDGERQHPVDAVRAIVYYGYGAPGFDRSMWPSTDWDGSGMTVEDYMAYTHILIADRMWCAGDKALAHTTEPFKRWACLNLFGYEYGTPGAPIVNENAVALKMQNAGAPSGFHVYQVDTGYNSIWGTGARSQTMITFDADVEVSFTKISADAKITADNGEYAYSGATYDIYDASNNAKVATITTDDNGHADYKLAPGRKYYAIETKAPMGFKVNSERVYFETGNNDCAAQLADDPGYVRLTVAKKDSATLGDPQPGATLAGAEFKCVSLSTPGWETTAKTNDKGVLYFTRVPFGKIVVTETKAPNGYKLDPTPHIYEVKSTEINDAGVVELEPADDFKENVVAFDLEIAKTKGGENDDWENDDGQAKPAAGVKFQIISNTTKKVVGTLTTNEYGFASTDDAATVNPEAVSEATTYDASKPWMGAGKRTAAHSGALPYDEAGYTIREVPETVPEGFDHVDDWQLTALQLADGAKLQFSAIDKTLNSKIQIVKTDAQSGLTVPLAGFSFHIIDARGNKVSMTEANVDTFTTGEDGTVTLPDRLPAGDYKVREAAAQAPYLLAGEDVPFSISGDYTQTTPATVVKVSDKQAHGIGRISKSCTEDDCPHAGEGGGLEGAEFDVVAMEDVVSPDGTVQAAEGQVMDHVVTGEDGKAETGLLPLGDGDAAYAFVETKAPAGHVLDKTPVEFTLTWIDDETEVVYAEASAKNAPTETIVGKTVMGEGAALPGAVFDLWPDFLESTATPADAGKGALAITLDGDDADISLTRTYAAAELAADVPEGYVVALVDGSGDSRIVGDSALGVVPGDYTVRIKDKDGTTIDLGDEAAIEVEAGMSYTVTYTEGILGWGAGLSIDKTELPAPSYDESDFTFEDDVASIDGLEPGTWSLAVKGLGDAIDIQVAPGAYAHAMATSETGLVPASHTLVPGARRALADVYGELGIELTTGKDGKIDVKHLPAERAQMADLLIEAGMSEDALESADLTGLVAWHLQEVKAPEGFLTDPEIRTFTIHEDGMTEGKKVYEVGVEDDYTKIEISKRDITDEGEIAGAKLTIADKTGKVVASWTSTSEPHRIDGLAPGDYTLTEEMTPNTYDKATSIEFTVLATGAVQKVVMYDEPIQITGEIDKRQEIADPTAKDHEENGDGQNKAQVTVSEDGAYDYSIDYRSTSSTWTDEFTVEDELMAAEDGVAELTGITTAQGWQDYDGLMNVWYRTNQTPSDYADDTTANATLSDNHANPWLTDETNAERLGDDGRAIDYTGWRLWKADVSTTEATELKVADLDLAEDELVTGVRFEYGRVEAGFTTRTDEWDRENLKSGHDDLDDVKSEHTGDAFEVEEHNVLELADGTAIRMSDKELAAAEDGAGYLVDPDCDGTPEFVPAENVKHVEAQEVSFAPAIMHMQVTEDYVEGTQLDNAAKVDLYRNGGGNDLEDHDKDFVTQVPKKVVREAGNLDQTGSNQLMAAVAFGAAALAATGALAYRRKTACAAVTPEDDGPNGGPDNGPAEGSADKAPEPGQAGDSEAAPDDEAGDAESVKDDAPAETGGNQNE